MASKLVISFEYRGDYAAPGQAYLAYWSDDKFRYHVWLTEGGACTNERIYKNQIGNKRHNPRYLDLTAVANAPARAALLEAIADGALTEAKAAWQAKQDAEKRAAEEKSAERFRNLLASILNSAPISATGIGNLLGMLPGLTIEQLNEWEAASVEYRKKSLT